MKLAKFFSGILLSGMVWACVEQEPSRPTEEDIRIIKQNILAKAPEKIKFKVNADLEGKVIYLGLDVDKDIIVPGEQFTLAHYWKVLQPVEGWEIFVHLNGEGKKGYINADHKAIGNRYPASQWKAGDIVRDEHKVSLPANWNSGDKVMVFTGLWKGPLRMKIKGPQDSEGRILAATLPVKAKVVAPPPPPKRLVATKTKKPIKIDGKLDDEVWSKAASTGPFVETMQGTPSPLKSEVKAAWDDQYLYLAFMNEDEDIWSALKNRDDKLWTQEAVEVFIDANSDGKDYIELQVNPNNAIFDSYLPGYRENKNDWNSKMKTAVSIEGTLNKRGDKDKSWSVEMAIPWQDTKGQGTYVMAFPPKVGDSWRVNFFRLDLPDKQAQLAAAWSPPLVGDFHKLDRFGQLVFGDEEGKAPPTTAQEPAPGSSNTAAAANFHQLPIQPIVKGVPRQLRPSDIKVRRLVAQPNSPAAKLEPPKTPAKK
jgi:hypothetical protein